MDILPGRENFPLNEKNILLGSKNSVLVEQDILHVKENKDFHIFPSIQRALE